MSVRYVATRGALKKIARSDEVAHNALLPAAENGARTAEVLSGEKFNVKVYKRGAFRARAVIFPNAVSIKTERKRRALTSAVPRL